jgi:hypothetical protein
MKWNQDIFVNNIATIIHTMCHDNSSKFNGIIGSRDAATRWKTPGYRPSLDILLTVTEKFDVTMDWLLTGTEQYISQIQGVAERQATYCAEPVEVKIACRQLKAILLSDHPVIKPALQSNLAAFQYSIEKEKSQEDEIRKLGRRLKFLEDRHKAEKDTGADAAASSSTGKPET